MGIGKASDFVVYDEEFYSGMYEGIAQATNGFNAASLNTMRLVTNQRKGDFVKESFFKDISALIAHRDPTSVGTATDLAMTHGEFASVKVHRIIGPVAQTLDAWRKVAKDPREMSFIMGKMIAQHKAMDFINTALLCVTAALKAQSGLLYDATGGSTKTVTHGHLVSVMSKLGDRASDIRCWVSHSKNYFDLMQQTITDKVYEVAGVTIYSGNVASFGKPWVVIDSSSLIDLNGSATDTYNVLGLSENGVVIEESEQQDLVSEIVTGLDNLVFRIQGEYAFNVGVKGFAYDYANGGADPSDVDLGTSTNWDLAVTSIKNGPGVRLKVQ